MSSISLGGPVSILAFAIGIPLLIVYLAWYYSRSHSILEQWAETNGYTILHSEYKRFFRGPFFWSTSKEQAVYYVKVRNRDGRLRCGWVRCGGLLVGMFSSKVEVEWDDDWS